MSNNSVLDNLHEAVMENLRVYPADQSELASMVADGLVELDEDGPELADCLAYVLDSDRSEYKYHDVDLAKGIHGLGEIAMSSQNDRSRTGAVMLLTMLSSLRESDEDIVGLQEILQQEGDTDEITRLRLVQAVGGYAREQLDQVESTIDDRPTIDLIEYLKSKGTSSLHEASVAIRSIGQIARGALDAKRSQEANAESQGPRFKFGTAANVGADTVSLNDSYDHATWLHEFGDTIPLAQVLSSEGEVIGYYVDLTLYNNTLRKNAEKLRSDAKIENKLLGAIGQLLTTGIAVGEKVSRRLTKVDMYKLSAQAHGGGSTRQYYGAVGEYQGKPLIGLFAATNKSDQNEVLRLIENNLSGSSSGRFIKPKE